jgi:hypothetical protein
LPLIFTSAPADPVEGENDFTEGDGAGTIAKAEVLASAPPGVSTTIGPLVVPAATTAVIFESEFDREARSRGRVEPHRSCAREPRPFDDDGDTRPALRRAEALDGRHRRSRRGR